MANETEKKALATMEWSFRYEGSVAPTRDMRCVTCLAGERTECPTHGQSFADNCAHCVAAKGGACHKHWGVKAAMEHIKGTAHITPEARPDFEQACAQVLLEISERKNVSLTMRGSRTETSRELVIEIDRRG